jgi:hypothetical protein
MIPTKTRRISHRTLFFMREYGPHAHIASNIIRESLYVLLPAAIISSLGGIGLEVVRTKFLTILPLVILLPALNDMVGDFGTVISSKFTIALYRGYIKEAWWRSQFVRELGRVERVVGLEGRTTERAALGPVAAGSREVTTTEPVVIRSLKLVQPDAAGRNRLKLGASLTITGNDALAMEGTPEFDANGQPITLDAGSLPKVSFAGRVRLAGNGDVGRSGRCQRLDGVGDTGEAALPCPRLSHVLRGTHDARGESRGAGYAHQELRPKLRKHHGRHDHRARKRRDRRARQFGRSRASARPHRNRR